MPNENRRKQLVRKRRKNAGKLPPSKSKAAPLVEPKAETSRRDFLTLRFPKQPATLATKGKRKPWDKKKLARQQRRKIAKISDSVLAVSKQPQAGVTELSPISQFPTLQAPSRRKFIKMAGMTVAAAALWRQAVAAGGSPASSAWTGVSGTGTFSSGYNWQSSQRDDISEAEHSREDDAGPGGSTNTVRNTTAGYETIDPGRDIRIHVHGKSQKLDVQQAMANAIKNNTPTKFTVSYDPLPTPPPPLTGPPPVEIRIVSMWAKLNPNNNYITVYAVVSWSDENDGEHFGGDGLIFVEGWIWDPNNPNDVK